jgi:Zn finger protein HypA/HybF involved in hydrogenase expression
MHEASLMSDLVGKIVEIAEREGASRVARVDVRIGALSHATPTVLAEHFLLSAAGTVAADADLVSSTDTEVAVPGALDVVLTAVHLEEN